MPFCEICRIFTKGGGFFQMRRTAAFLKNARKKVQKSGKIGIVFPLRKWLKNFRGLGLVQMFSQTFFRFTVGKLMHTSQLWTCILTGIVRFVPNGEKQGGALHFMHTEPYIYAIFFSSRCKIHLIFSEKNYILFPFV